MRAREVCFLPSFSASPPVVVTHVCGCAPGWTDVLARNPPWRNTVSCVLGSGLLPLPSDGHVPCHPSHEVVAVSLPPQELHLRETAIPIESKTTHHSWWWFISPPTTTSGIWHSRMSRRSSILRSRVLIADSIIASISEDSRSPGYPEPAATPACYPTRGVRPPRERPRLSLDSCYPQTLGVRAIITKDAFPSWLRPLHERLRWLRRKCSTGNIRISSPLATIFRSCHTLHMASRGNQKTGGWVVFGNMVVWGHPVPSGRVRP